MSFDIALTELIGTLLAGVRIVTWLVIAPPFSYRAIPIQVKTLLATALALAIEPATPATLSTDQLLQGELILAVLQEVMIGAGLGFLCLVLYLTIQAAGNVIDMLGGFMMAFTFDAQLNAGVATLGRFYHLTALALLFATNSHLLILRGLLKTFDLLPVGQGMEIGRLAELTQDAVGVFMLTALQIAGPLVAVLFLTDVGLGLLSRIAPQLNVLMLAFPLKIGVTLLLVAASFAGLPNIVSTLTDLALSYMARAVR